MTTVLDVPSGLGSYMLKGWVLTDRSCPTSGCRIPLLRSPAGQDPVVHFCISCDENPNVSRQPSVVPPIEAPQPDTSTSTLTSSGSPHTTPFTSVAEISVVSDELPPFVESEASRRRREQTDRASAMIGQRLLQGWTLLGEECIREACYFVPLVRPPKKAGEPDPKKECVLCGSIYVTEKDWAGRETLVLVNPDPSQQTAPPAANADSNTHRRTTQADESSTFGNMPSAGLGSIRLQVTAFSIVGTLDASAEALRLSLQTLTTRLTSLSSNPTLADPANIATTADAISKVTQALSHIKQLQWSEMQAHSMT